MKPYYKNLAWKKLRWHRTRSLLHYLRNSMWFRQPRQVRRLGSKRLHSLKTMPYFKRYSIVNVKTLPYFVKRVFGLNLQPSAPVLSGSLISANAVPFPYLSPTTGRRLAGGQQAKARPSTCKTSSEDRSYAKRLWLQRGINSSSGISRRLNREYLHGFQITQTCLTSSRLEATLTPRSVRRCLTYPDLVRKATLTYGSLRRAHCSVAVMGWGGQRSRHNFSRDFWGRHRNGTIWALQRNLVLPKPWRRSS